MKSLLISSMYFPPQVGGISHYMGAVAAALGSERVCCLTDVRAGDPARCGNPVQTVYRRPSAFAKSYGRQALGLGAALTEIMVRERPRAVQLGTVGDGHLGLRLARWLRLPFVVYAHGNEILGLAQADCPVSRRALQRASSVLANSQFTAGLVRDAGVDPSRIRVVHPACDVERFRPHDVPAELRQKVLGTRSADRVILTVGNIVARKGHDMVIRALGRLRDRDSRVTYLIVGDGPHRRHLEELATTIGVRDHVVFAGRVADWELPDFYALSNVFVMASREQRDACDVEGFGLVFLEANACERPVIGGRSGGIPDAVVDGVTGLLVDPEDPDDIARALWQILDNREFGMQLGRQGHARVIRDLTWSRAADRIQEIVRDAVREGAFVDDDRQGSCRAR